MELYIVLACLVATVVNAFMLGIVLMKLSKKKQLGSQEMSQLTALKTDLSAQQREMRTELNNTLTTTIKNLGEILASSQKASGDQQNSRIAGLSEQLYMRQETLQKTLNDQLRKMDERLVSSAIENETKLNNIRNTIEQRLSAMQTDNAKKLDEMRATVDEKLQKTLEDRISQSFKVVSERLEQVYKGLGEMQNLAAGVGDLKKVLSNVKTRGVLGEIQLGSILDEILSPEQFDENVEIKKGTYVEFAVKMPGEGDDFVYLPIDAKFPMDSYMKLNDAYESGSPQAVELAAKELTNRIKSFAKDIRDKYIDPPKTTDFAILFLPTEGLYAEAVRLGLIEILQRDFRINIAGPSTMAALLNSLQMGFRTLAIQKRTSEVWEVLAGVRKEFDNFADVLTSTQRQLELAGNSLEKLVSTRTRAIQRKLRDVTELPDTQDDGTISIAKQEV